MRFSSGFSMVIFIILFVANINMVSVMGEGLFLWLRNPSFVVGVNSYVLIRRMEFLRARSGLLEMFSSLDPVLYGESEVFFNVNRFDSVFGVSIRLEHRNEMVHGMTVSVFSNTRYRVLDKSIRNVGFVFDDVSGSIAGYFNVYSVDKWFYIECPGRVPEILKSLDVDEISGSTRDISIRFIYLRDRLMIRGSIDSNTLNWIKRFISTIWY